MMILTQEGAQAFWKYILKITTPPNPYVHLLGTSYANGHGSTLANFLANELPMSSGYAPIQLVNPGSDWTLANVAAGATATYNTLTWTFTGALTVYGYWVSDDTNSWSWWGESLVPAFTFLAAGGVFTLSLPPYLISCPGVSSC